jgi:hypothetical protein
MPHTDTTVSRPQSAWGTERDRKGCMLGVLDENSCLSGLASRTSCPPGPHFDESATVAQNSCDDLGSLRRTEYNRYLFVAKSRSHLEQMASGKIGWGNVPG